MENQILLEIADISKAFGITKACQNISFTINKGEIHGLIGENGSGKSTLTSMIYGLQPQDSGKFIFLGKEYRAANQLEANSLGISAIVQEAGTLSGLTVAQNMFLGKEKEFIEKGFLNNQKMNAAADLLLKEYGFESIKGSDIVDKYNFEIRKLIEIVKATYFKTELVIVDETTTALSQDGREILYGQMEKIRNSGRTVIFISHDLDEVMDRTDRVSVLRDGEYITTVNTKEVTADKLKELMVGRKVDNRYYRMDYGTEISKDVVFSMQHVTTHGLLKDVSLELHKGEILGIGGLSDCGIHEIGKVMFGAERDYTGEVKLSDGRKVESIAQAIADGIAYTSKDRDNESVILNASIKNNICMMAYDSLKKGIFISPSKCGSFANEFAQKLSVKMQGIEQDVAGLSGGNKQKVVLARWLAINPDILIFDSPTRGIDIKVKADIYNVMDGLRKEGKSIIMISEEIMELIGMCDRILILKNGVINGEFMRKESLQEQDLIRKMI